ncbi:MAG: hypothetical protein EZS28_023017 [Streblomastix strix]|uniref:Right handed beta helix domain-containing protein n=1 Tax=Streblomastix strix TaxID=222440 RepID=A0A5J4VFV2_9EUKA|nr:MAG: hypothetical protein EZS28_023017 [Streblomastix strix]
MLCLIIDQEQRQFHSSLDLQTLQAEQCRVETIQSPAGQVDSRVQNGGLYQNDRHAFEIGCLLAMKISLLLCFIIVFSENYSQQLPASSTIHTSACTIPLESNHKPPYKSSNTPCIYTVGVNTSSSNHQKTIQAVLNQECTDGYDITIRDYNHSESILVDQSLTAPAIIKGGFKSNAQLIHSTDTKTNYQSLTITSCLFNGVDIESYEYKMIDAPNIDMLIVTDCIFQNVVTLEQRLISCISNKNKAGFIFENTTFTNITIKNQHGFGTLVVFLNGTEQKLTINKCIFSNCSNADLVSDGGTIYLASPNQSVDGNEIIITNNKFINNTGYQTGGIYSFWNEVKCNFSNNEFIGNSKFGSDQEGCDARLTWQNQTKSLTEDEVKQKVIYLFEGSTSKYWSSVSYLYTIRLKDIISGHVDLDISVDYCKSKEDLTSECICYEYYTLYPVKQCVKEQLCITDLGNQTASNCPYCPCLSTGDPRANKACPAYCDKGNITTQCVCDTNKEGFTVAQCMLEKECKFDLANQSTSDCPCLSTADPRANRTCPGYCIRGYTQYNCTCDSQLPSYPIDQCLKEKNCSFDLDNQTVANCPCLATGDPRAGDTCPSYCIKGYVTSDCVCDFYIPDYTVAQCQKEKACKYNLINQTSMDCPCLNTSDPRAGKACPEYCVKGKVTSECIVLVNQQEILEQEHNVIHIV